MSANRVFAVLQDIFKASKLNPKFPQKFLFIESYHLEGLVVLAFDLKFSAVVL